MPNSAPNSRRPGYSGRVHLQFFDRQSGQWWFVCPRREGDSVWGVSGEVVESDAVVTCVNCIKHGPEIVEKMDRIPSLDEFQ